MKKRKDNSKWQDKFETDHIELSEIKIKLYIIVEIKKFKADKLMKMT